MTTDQQQQQLPTYPFNPTTTEYKEHWQEIA